MTEYAYDGHFDKYTCLRTLTIFMDSYNMCQGSWYMLGPFLERGIETQHLRKLTIDVRVEFVTGLDAVIDWAALDRLKDVLECTKFSALQELEVIVQHKEELPWDPAEEMKELLKRVEERLYGISDAGVHVITRYWRVKEVGECIVARRHASLTMSARQFYDTIISLRPGVL